MPRRVLATMITTTSYGTWLPGDLRGYVEDGVILPGSPHLLDHSESLLVGDPVFFTPREKNQLFEALVAGCHEFTYHLLAASIESWHAHWLVDHGFDPVEVMVGRLKTRMRQALHRGRIWTSGYDHRLCFTQAQVTVRLNYIRRHAGHRPLAEQPPAGGRD